MLIDGEKWACEACVRGHRVSGCQHSERVLQRIAKKGRPVSQCPHCRSMRKSRASHVKCDCGEKTHKCQHLQQTVDGHTESCCCNHGGRCTCSHKKDTPLDTVPEFESESDHEHDHEHDQEHDCHSTMAQAVIRRRRANTSISEPVLSFDENGHHKPAHKHNKTAQKCGPYSLNRGYSMTSTSSTSSLDNRSMDNLVYGKATGRPRKETVGSEQKSRRTKSEQASPSIGGSSSLQQLNGQLPPLDLSNIQYPEYTPTFELFGGGLTDEPPIYSAGLSAASVDWGQYDGLDLKGDAFAPSSYDQAQSFTAGFDVGSTEPTLTSNSGDVSEAEDFVAFSEAQIEGFRNSAATTYITTQNQASVLANAELGGADFAQFKGAAAANKFLPNLGSLDDVGAGVPMLDEEPYWTNDAYSTSNMNSSPFPGASAYWDAQ